MEKHSGEFKVEQFWGTFMTLGYLRWCNFILLCNIKDKYCLLLHYTGVCCRCAADKDLTCKRRNSISGAVIGGLAWQRSTTAERIVSLKHLLEASACRNSTFWSKRLKKKKKTLMSYDLFKSVKSVHVDLISDKDRQPKPAGGEIFNLCNQHICIGVFFASVSFNKISILI